jgi:hypothetical protein
MSKDDAKINIPEYRSEIYEFDSEAIETGVKEFLFSSPKL